MLIAQHYSLADDEAHLRALLTYFHDLCYIRIHNKPLFLVYRSSGLPDPRNTTTLLGQLAKQHGLDGLVLVKVESFPTERTRHPELDGFDAALDFQPDWDPSPRHCNHPSAGSSSTSSAWPAPIHSAPTECSHTPSWRSL